MTELILNRAQLFWSRARNVSTVWMLSLAIIAGLLILDPVKAPEVLQTALDAFLGTVPFILIAVGLMAYLKATDADGVVAEAFKGRQSRMIVLAALVGGLAPFCSCEVIPFIAALLAAGTPLPAVMAFWLSSPLMDPPTFAITAGTLGTEYAIAKGVAAVGLGLLGGFVLAAIMRHVDLGQPLKVAPAKGCCKSSCGTGRPAKPVWRFWTEAPRLRVFGATMVEQGLFLTKWLVFAYLLEGLMIHYVPAEAIASVVGGEGLLSIIAGALVGMPAYLNGYAAPTVVDGLMTQGMTAGAAMAFLVAGAVSSIPAAAAVWALVKPRIFALYLGFGLGGAVLAGVIFSAVV